MMAQLALRLRHRICDCIEDRHAVLELLTALPRGHSRNHRGAILEHLPGMEGPLAARDPLHHQPGAPVDEDAHAAFRASCTTR